MTNKRIMKPTINSKEIKNKNTKIWFQIWNYNWDSHWIHWVNFNFIPVNKKYNYYFRSEKEAIEWYEKHTWYKFHDNWNEVRKVPINENMEEISVINDITKNTRNKTNKIIN